MEIRTLTDHRLRRALRLLACAWLVLAGASCRLDLSPLVDRSDEFRTVARAQRVTPFIICVPYRGLNPVPTDTPAPTPAR